MFLWTALLPLGGCVDLKKPVFEARDGSTISEVDAVLPMTDTVSPMRDMQAAGDGAIVPDTRSTDQAPPTPDTPVVQEPGLVVHLAFDETSGTTATDASGNGNHGNIAGVARWIAGKMGGALDFARMTDVVVANRANQVLPADNGSFSIATWIYVRSTTAAKFNTFLRSDLYPSSGVRFGFDSTGKAWFWSSENSGTMDAIAPAPIVLNTWHHVAGTFDKPTATGKLYVDGQQLGIDTTSTWVSGPNDVHIGGLPTGTEPLDGLLDDLRIYNRALTPDEVRQLAGR